MFQFELVDGYISALHNAFRDAAIALFYRASTNTGLLVILYTLIQTAGSFFFSCFGFSLNFLPNVVKSNSHQGAELHIQRTVLSALFRTREPMMGYHRYMTVVRKSKPRLPYSTGPLLS